MQLSLTKLLLRWSLLPAIQTVLMVQQLLLVFMQLQKKLLPQMLMLPR